MDHTLCWWCCHPWDGDVLHMPYKIEPKTNNYLTMGQFCSWSCMKSFNMDKNGLHKGSTINGLITTLHKKMTGKFKLLKLAPSRYTLKSFGGKLSIEEFRNLNKDEKVEIRFPNQVQISQNIIKQSKITFEKPSEEELDKKMNNINNSLKLKRTKPLKRDVNNLETMMGLTRTKHKQ